MAREAKSTHQDVQERDRRVEEVYAYHREDPFMSTPAYVSQNRDELAQDFFAWLGTIDADSGAADALPMWEVSKFGAELEPVAHGIMRFAVKCGLSKGPKLPDPQWPSVAIRVATEAAASKLPVNPLKDTTALELVTALCVDGGLAKPKGVVVRKMPEVEPTLPYRDSDDDAPLPEWAKPKADPIPHCADCNAWHPVGECPAVIPDAVDEPSLPRELDGDADVWEATDEDVPF